MRGSSAGSKLPRFAPEEALPPYAYVPGRFPHPTRDPRGHLFRARSRRPAAPDPARWRASRTYLYGVDLFNHGYYWEAHEAWEGLWHACGRKGQTARFLRGLIHLAAAGVKLREQRPAGVRAHGRRAAELFRQTALGLGGDEVRYMGLGLGPLIAFADLLARRPERARETPGEPVERVFDFVLAPA